MRMVTLPGIGGSDDRHWQTLWERESGDMIRFAPSSWDEPEYDDWSNAVQRSVGAEPSVLIAHSLSCLLAVRWTHANPGRVAGLFLVGPPDPTGSQFPRQAVSFGSDLAVPVSVPAILIRSTDDPFCSSQQSEAFAEMWGIPLISVGDRGHLNSDSGLGSWAEGRNLLAAFVAGIENKRR